MSIMNTISILLTLDSTKITVQDSLSLSDSISALSQQVMQSQNLGFYSFFYNPWVIAIGSTLVVTCLSLCVRYIHRRRKVIQKAKSLIKEAEKYLKANRISEAFELFDKAIAELNHVRKPKLLAEALNGKGRCHFALAEIDNKEEHALKGILLHQEVIKIVKEKTSQAAMAYSCQGSCYGLMAGVRDKEKNLTAAIESFETSLKYYIDKSLQKDIILVENNLGVAYRILAGIRDAENNIEKALSVFKSALEHRLSEDLLGRALTYYNLGTTYIEQSQLGESQARLLNAISAYNMALQIYTLESNPKEYAKVKNGIGNAYASLSEICNKEINARQAITAYQEALTVRSMEKYPIDFGMTQGNMGNAYTILYQSTKSEKDIQCAIDAYESSLKIRLPGAYPIDFATSQHNSGLAYLELSRIKKNKDYAFKSIAAFQQSLLIRTVDKYPIDYATSQNSLGTSYTWLAEFGNDEQMWLLSIEAFKNALVVRSKDQRTWYRACTENNLGNSHLGLSKFQDKEKNLKIAQSYVLNALSIFTISEYPNQNKVSQVLLSRINDALTE